MTKYTLHQHTATMKSDCALLQALLLALLGGKAMALSCNPDPVPEPTPFEGPQGWEPYCGGGGAVADSIEFVCFQSSYGPPTAEIIGHYSALFLKDDDHSRRLMKTRFALTLLHDTDPQSRPFALNSD